MRSELGKTFKVKSKRSDKSFPMNSDEIVRAVASTILKNSSWKVDVHKPDVMVNVEIRDEAAYIFTKTVKGAGGYP
jgi:thiamine biosynthesis protein ThiI